MTDDYNIHEIDPQDNLQAFHDIIRLQTTTMPYDLTLIPSSKDHWWVATLGNVSVGFASLSEVAPKIACLSRAGVLKKHRGHGLHRKLINLRIEKARELGFKTVVSTTFANPESANNLIAYGFRQYEPKKSWLQVGTDYWKRKV